MFDRPEQVASNRVMAVFPNMALSFDLPRETTFEELAEELGALGELWGGMPLYVDVRLRT